MNRNWQQTTLGQHVDLATGPAFQSADFALSPLDAVRLARGDNVKEGVFEWGEKSRFWPKMTEELKKFLLDVGDVLIGMDGSKVGKNWVRVTAADLPCLLVQRVARLRARPTLDQRFLRFLIGNSRFVEYVDSVKTGTSIPHISGGQIRGYPVLLPPVAEQRRIADILGSLDDKIELNRRTNETLESMARTLFWSWFVDFDPVRAHADCQTPPGVDAATAKLFPDSFEPSALGPIPKGWRVGTLAETLSELETGNRPKGGVSGITSGVPSIGAESINGLGVFDFTKTKFVPQAFFDAMGRGHVRSRDVLLYKDGGRPGMFEPHVAMFGDDFPFSVCSINEHVYRLRANDLLSQAFLYFWLSDELALAEMRVKGTGVAVPGLNSTAVRSLKVLVPPKEIVTAFDRFAEPLITAVLRNAKEQVTLTATRDALLPKLLSGEVRV